MESETGFIFKNTMKNARKLYKNMSLTFVLFIVIYNVIIDYVVIPLLGKLWGLALTTTPEGFISNANAANAIAKSPWIIPIGLALIFIIIVLALWQSSIIITGIGYMHEGQKIKFKDLFHISILNLGGRKFKKNWVVLLYTLVILPFSCIYETNSVIGSFIIPEYIQDFINAKTLLFILFIVAALLLLFLALKWFFIFPSFFLKKKDFKDAVLESNVLTSKKFIRNWVNLILYSLLETLRILVVPVILVMLPLVIAYLCTSGLNYASSLFTSIGLSYGLDIVFVITSPLLQISIMCFIIELYFEKLNACGETEGLSLPALEEESNGKKTVNFFHNIESIAIAVIIFAAYLVIVNVAQTNSSIITNSFMKTEIIAHKGYSSKAPENTMPAFELADKCDAVTYIELDVWSTKDGVPVVIHNASIKEATGIDKNIYECTYDEIKDLPAPYSMNAADFPDAKIPTLEEVIKAYGKSTPLLIEIKGFSEDPDLPAKIVELMKKYGCEYTSLIHSGDYGALKAVKQVDSKIKCGLILAMVTGDYYYLPYADFFSVEHTFITQTIADNIHNTGKKIFAWTVNYEESAEDLKFVDVDGLITDYPDDINEYVAEENTLVDNAKKSSFFESIPEEETGAAAALDNYEEGAY